MPFGLWTPTAWPKNHVLDGGPEVPRDVAMATNFGTKIAVTGFVSTIAMEGFGFEWSADRMPILLIPCT